MGACAGKVRRSESDETHHTVSERGVSSTAHSVEIEAAAESRPIAETVANEAECSTVVRISKRAQKHARASKMLAERVEYWERSERVSELSTQALHEHYHRDTRVLLESLDYLEQVTRTAEDAYRCFQHVHHGRVVLDSYCSADGEKESAAASSQTRPAERRWPSGSSCAGRGAQCCIRCAECWRRCPVFETSDSG